jgi:hypothetical protein
MYNKIPACSKFLSKLGRIKSQHAQQRAHEIISQHQAAPMRSFIKNCLKLAEPTG